MMMMGRIMILFEFALSLSLSISTNKTQVDCSSGGTFFNDYADDGGEVKERRRCSVHHLHYHYHHHDYY